MTFLITLCSLEPLAITWGVGHQKNPRDETIQRIQTLSNEDKNSHLTSAGDIVIGQHSSHLTLAYRQVGVRVPLTVVWVAMAAVKIDLNLHLTVSLHGWTRNQTQTVGLVQFFLPSSDKGKKIQPKIQQAPTPCFLLCIRADSPTPCGHIRNLLGAKREEFLGPSSKQRGLEANWSGNVWDWACAFEPDHWCLSWLRDWEGPRTVQKYLKKTSQLKIWPVEWNMPEWNAWKAKTGGEGAGKRK